MMVSEANACQTALHGVGYRLDARRALRCSVMLSALLPNKGFLSCCVVAAVAKREGAAPSPADANSGYGNTHYSKCSGASIEVETSL